MIIYVKQNISCAHQLELPYPSPCNRLHGHNYLVEVFVEGEPGEGDKNNMIVDFNFIKEIIKKYDHQNLNEMLDTPSTVEGFCRCLRTEIQKLTPCKVRVRVWESEGCYAEE